jgi:hypothetical protein
VFLQGEPGVFELLFGSEILVGLERHPARPEPIREKLKPTYGQQVAEVGEIQILADPMPDAQRKGRSPDKHKSAKEQLVLKAQPYRAGIRPQLAGIQHGCSEEFGR